MRPFGGLLLKGGFQSAGDSNNEPRRRGSSLRRMLRFSMGDAMSNLFKGLHICGPATNDYMRWEDESATRHKRGERQKECGGCGKWYWPEWEENVAQHADCKAPTCAKCGSRDLTYMTRAVSKKDLLAFGTRCLACGEERRFKEGK